MLIIACIRSGHGVTHLIVYIFPVDIFTIHLQLQASFVVSCGIRFTFNEIDKINRFGAARRHTHTRMRSLTFARTHLLWRRCHLSHVTHFSVSKKVCVQFITFGATKMIYECYLSRRSTSINVLVDLY